jgi:hypothetical protein
MSSAAAQSFKRRFEIGRAAENFAAQLSGLVNAPLSRHA